MFDFLILTPSFNRMELLKEVISHLQAEAKEHGFSVMHCIVDDGSDWRFHPYETAIPKMAKNNYQIQVVRNYKNYGRYKFWKTWNALLKMAQEHEWGYAIAIPDDHELCQDFMKRTRAAMLAIQKKDRTAVAMNILVTARKSWRRNRYVDGAFICTRKFFEVLKWRLTAVGPAWFDQPFSKKRRHPVSSGVGKQMTERLSRCPHARIARVRDVSFMRPLRCDSKMFPPDIYPRRPKAWGRNNFIDAERNEEEKRAVRASWVRKNR